MGPNVAPQKPFSQVQTAQGDQPKSSQGKVTNSQQMVPTPKQGQEKVMITGDDILIEYVSRLITRLNRV